MRTLLFDISINNPASTSSAINWPTLLASAGSIAISLLVIYYNSKNTRGTIDSNERNISASIAENRANIEKTLSTNKEINEQNLKSKLIEQRKDEIYKILNELYGPLSLLRKKSSLLYEKFKIGKKTNKDNRFSALLYLLENGGPNHLSNNDKQLLNEIIQIGASCEKLLHDKAGLIEDEVLRNEVFPNLSKHYLIIRLAYQEKLKGQTDLYEDSMFPTEVDSLIDRKIQSLHRELQNLH